MDKFLDFCIIGVLASGAILMIYMILYTRKKS